MASESEFPSNSIVPKSPLQKTEKAKDEPPKKVEKVVTGRVVERKKGMGKRILQSFTGEDSTKSVFESLILELAIPEIKYLGAMLINQGVERKFGLSTSMRPGPRQSGAIGISRVPYDRFSGANVVAGRPDPRTANPSARNHMGLRDLVLETRVEADEVLATMFGYLEEYGFVTVASYYDALGCSSESTDLKWGWTSLGAADVRRVKDGYVIVLPRPEPID